jgi:hypothetical protein
MFARSGRSAQSADNLTRRGRTRLSETDALWAKAQRGFEAAFGRADSEALREGLRFLISADFAAGFERPARLGSLKGRWRRAKNPAPDGLDLVWSRLSSPTQGKIFQFRFLEIASISRVVLSHRRGRVFCEKPKL